jgi:antitoxin component YwqK of YwqJK toxin-antitoxin module
MKKTLIILALLISGAIYAQDSGSQEKNVDWQAKDNLVQGTYYFDNGTVHQQGTFNQNGKLHGEWVMFDRKGNKTALGTYTNGKKDGKWFFWEENQLTEVDFNSNEIMDVTQWRNQQSIAAMN